MPGAVVEGITGGSEFTFTLVAEGWIPISWECRPDAGMMEWTLVLLILRQRNLLQNYQEEEATSCIRTHQQFYSRV
jgi:hypothetical protein